MQVDIKSVNIAPLRHTFDQVARFLGSDKPASRYLEATIGLQPEVNFHYRPLWDPEHEIYDKRRTAVVMQDWYKLLDPRQYYYGAWAMARAKQQDGAERNFEFVEKRGLIELLTPEWKREVETVVLPLRHLEYAANLNNCYMSAYGYGTAITQATMMCAQDRLGIAQYLTRIGLCLDGNSGDSLRRAKALWQDDPVWQPMRMLAEDMLVTKDWFELFVAQNVVLDGLVYPLVYGHFDSALAPNGGSAFAMLTEFMSEWFAEHTRWVDQTLRIAAGESDANRATIGAWYAKWQPAVLDALEPLARRALGENAHGALAVVAQDLSARIAACGLEA
jgi:phenol hydroxylase P1 protein